MARFFGASSGTSTRRRVGRLGRLPVMGCVLALAGCESTRAAGDSGLLDLSDGSVSTDGGSRCSIALPDVGWGLTTQGTTFVDALGRHVNLRGVNAGGHSKQRPRYLPFDFTERDFPAALDAYMDRAASWGVDVLRVPFAWAAVEPTPGSDDALFLTRLDALLDAAWERRIFTIVDFHQDVYAAPFCGDGFPTWTLPGPVDDDPGDRDCDLWFSGYQFDSDVKAAFDRFWTNQGGVQSAYRELWDRMAARYRDRPGVMGFEMLNEPGWGNATLPLFEATTLRDFLSTMAGRIHAIAPDALVFFDLPGIDALSLKTSLPEPNGANLVFAPHYYQLAAFDGDGNASRVESDLETWANRGGDWGIPTFVGEFGISHDAVSPGAYVAAHWSAFDALGIHGAQWEYSVSEQPWNGESLGIVQADGSEYTSITDEIVRVYPRAVAGTDAVFSYDASTRRFSLDYVATPQGITEIAVPSRIYSDAPARIEVDGGCADTTRTDGIVPVSAFGAGPVRVVITPG